MGKRVTSERKQDPLHGITLEKIVIQLEEKYGWEQLGQKINIKCFTTNPSISSSLKFLRRTPWARKKVEALYLKTNWTKTSVWGASKTKD
jgi:uncharacterized protein (DUF2132 family)